MSLRIEHVEYNGRGYAMMTPVELRAAGVPDEVWMARYLKSYAAQKRWQIEVSGTTLNGAFVPTDDRAKTLITGAAAWLAAAETTTLVIGTTVSIVTGAQIKAMRDAVCDHVDRSFMALGEVYAAINAGTITTTVEIDAFAWPGQSAA